MTTTTNFSRLQSNLSEIYAAVYNNNTPASISQINAALPLAVTSTGSLYRPHGWMGRTISVVDSVWKMTYHTDHGSLEQVLLSTLTVVFDTAVLQAYEARQVRIRHMLFQLNTAHDLDQLNLDQQRERYAMHIEYELGNSPLSKQQTKHIEVWQQGEVCDKTENELAKLRHLITQFHAGIIPFWKEYLAESRLRDNRLRDNMIRLINPHNTTISNSRLFQIIIREARCVQFLGILELDIPILSLAKLNSPSQLSHLEKKQLKEWVDKIEECQEQLTPQLLGDVLQEVVLILKLHNINHVTLQDLLYWLYEQNCSLITREDPVHMDWREALQSGSKITCNGQILTLGDELPSSKHIDNMYRVFKLSQMDDVVVRIACNSLLLPLADRLRDSEAGHWGIRLVETINFSPQLSSMHAISGCDELGMCRVEEKLISPLSQRVWISTNCILDEKDIKIALIFTNHIIHMITVNAAPTTLSLKDLMWKDHVLKSTHLLPKAAFDYDKVEEYCIKCSKQNRYVLQFMMHVSNLVTHPVAQYYRAAINFALVNGSTNLITTSLPSEHRQKSYETHITELAEQAIALRTNCLKLRLQALREQRQVTVNQSAIISIVSNRLLAIYNNLPTPGSFSNELMEKAFCESFEPASQIQNGFDINTSYYRQNQTLLKEYNTACASVQVYKP